MYLAYLGVTIPLLRKRAARAGPATSRTRKDGPVRARAVGQASLNVIAIVYGAAMVINLEWPRVALYVDDTVQVGPDRRHDRASLGFGLIYYYAIQRHKGGVLEEHRAEAVGGRLTCAGWAGVVPAHPVAACMEDLLRQLARRDAKAIRGGIALVAVAARASASSGCSRRRSSVASRSCSASFVQLNCLCAWRAGPQLMAERRPVLAPAVVAGIPMALGAYARLRRRRRRSSRRSRRRRS